MTRTRCTTSSAGASFLAARIRPTSSRPPRALAYGLVGLGLLVGCRSTGSTPGAGPIAPQSAAATSGAPGAPGAASASSAASSSVGRPTAPLALRRAIPTDWIATARRLDAAALRTDVADLASDAMAGRHWQQPGGFMAAGWVAARLRQAGFQPGASDGSWFEPLPTYPEAAPNVIGILPGRTHEIVLLTAHYDHLATRPARPDDPPGVDRIFNGADDNASGVAGLIAAAEALHTIASATPRATRMDDPYTSSRQPDPFEATIVCVAFSGEEAGLRGAREFAASSSYPVDRIRAMINMDMISRGQPNTLCVEGLGAAPTIAAAIDRANTHVGLNLQRDQNLDWLPRADQAPFLALGVPAVLFSVEDHPDYHQVTDHVERIDADLAIRAARLAALATALLADAERSPTTMAAPTDGARGSE